MNVIFELFGDLHLYTTFFSVQQPKFVTHCSHMSPWYMPSCKCNPFIVHCVWLLSYMRELLALSCRYVWNGRSCCSPFGTRDEQQPYVVRIHGFPSFPHKSEKIAEKTVKQPILRNNSNIANSILGISHSILLRRGTSAVRYKSNHTQGADYPLH